MLPAKFRIVLKNETGVTIDANRCTVKYRGKYFSSSGVLTFESESADIAAQSTTIANGAYHAGTTVDNVGKANPLVEADVYLDVDLSANTGTPNGTVICYLERATADTPVYGTPGLGEVLAAFNFPNAKVRRTTTVTVG